MTEKKDRIMDLMRRGIITEDEAVELLEKSGGSDSVKFDRNSADKKAEKAPYTDEDGYVNHDIDFGEAMKNTFGNFAEASKSTFGNFAEAGKKLFKGVSKAVDDNIEFGNGFPKVKSTSKTIEKDLEEFNAIKLDIKAGKVNVYPGENAHVKAEYKIYGAVDEENIDEYLATKTKLEVADGELLISTSDSLRTALDIDLYLPEKDYEIFEFEVTHGDVKVSQVSATKIEIHQVNGLVELSETRSKEVAINNKNGEIKMLDGATDQLKLDSVNGNIRVTSDFVDGDVSLINGNILLTQVHETAQKLAVKNINGDIKVSVPQSLGLVGRVKTTFGGYKTRLNLDNPFEAGRNGAAVVRAGAQTLTFELETKSGTIWLKDADAESEREQ